MAGRLGELLVRENLISLQQLQKAQDEQKKTGGRIGYHLTKLGSIEETELTSFLSKQYGVPSINLKEFDIDPEVIKLVPKEVAEKHQFIPVNRAGASLIIAMSDPSNIFAIDDIKFLTGYNIEVGRRLGAGHQGGHREVLRGEGPLLRRGDGGVRRRARSSRPTTRTTSTSSTRSAARPTRRSSSWCNLILLDAIKKGASDIHIEPYEKDFRVRFRIDGVLLRGDEAADEAEERRSSRA